MQSISAIQNTGPIEGSDDDVEKIDVIRFEIEGIGKAATSSLKQILQQINALHNRVVPIEISNVPDVGYLALKKIIQRNVGETPEYVPGKFILKTPVSEDKGRICVKISKAFDEWNGGSVSFDSIMTTDQNQCRAPDISWRQLPLTFAQRNNSYISRPMPDLWIEVCYNRAGDRNTVFEKVQAHLPSRTTVFVAIVLANKVTADMLQSLGVIGNSPSTAAPELAEAPVPPYIVVWNLGTTDVTYYNVHTGHYVDLQLANTSPMFRLNMDLICQALC
jgi:hypothetical protein